MKRYIIPIAISVLLTVLLYTLSIVFADYEETVAAIDKLPNEGWALILGLSLLNYLLRFLRWEYYIRASHELNLPKLKHGLMYFAGFALTTTPGKAGEAIRSFYLRPHGVKISHSLSALFVERLVDFIAMVFLAALAAWQFPDYRWLMGITIVIAIAGPMAIHSEPLLQLFVKFAHKLPEKIYHLVDHVVELIHASSNLLKNKLLYGGILFGLVAWGAEGLGFYFTLKYLGAETPYLLAISIYAIAILVGALSFIPAGLGGTEATMGVLLIALGVDPATAVASTLICRMATLWFAVLLGFGALGVLTQQGIMPDMSSTTNDKPGDTNNNNISSQTP